MTRKKYFFTVLILGLLSALSPLSIDMYLPGFAAIANSLHTSTAAVAISLSSFFVAVAVGQLIYGPLMDRYGRKKPLYIALTVYIVFSLGCLLIRSVHALIALRSLQGLGSCAAGVAAMTMVKDLFPEKDNAKVFSFMTLAIGISPMLAPTIGSFLTSAYGWSSVFVALSVIAAMILIAIKWGIDENFSPDVSLSLRPKAIAENFIAVLRVPQFLAYSLTVALAFAGMFAYIASSPTVFMVFFK